MLTSKAIVTVVSNFHTDCCQPTCFLFPFTNRESKAEKIEYTVDFPMLRKILDYRFTESYFVLYSNSEEKNLALS